MGCLIQTECRIGQRLEMVKFPFVLVQYSVKKEPDKSMSCRVCGSQRQTRLKAETAIHLPNLNSPHVFLFPFLLVCFDCGFTEFSIDETELQSLVDRFAGSASPNGPI